MSQDQSTKNNILTNPQREGQGGEGRGEQQIGYKDSQCQAKVNNNMIASKGKKNRKSMATKAYTQSKDSKLDNELSIEKQIKLTQFWKGATLLSQSVTKGTLPPSEIVKKKMEEEIQEKNKLIARIKNQRDVAQRKFNLLENQKKLYQNKAKQQIRQSLLQLAKIKREERSAVNPFYGYFDYSKDEGVVKFFQGPFLKQIRSEISIKTRQMQQVKQLQMLDTNTKKNKQLFHFQQRFIQKQLDELSHELQQRQSKVQAYKDRLKFAQMQNSCYYAKIGWPAVGEDERFQTLQLLGSGGFGAVFKCYDLVQNCYVALKENRFHATMGTKNEEQKQKYLKHMTREVKIQKGLNHPNIAKLIQVIKIDENQVSFILEYCEGPQLGKYLKKNKCIQQKQAKQIVRQIVCALKYLYEQDNKIIHYDLKPSNIMFHKGLVKVVDFGLCKQMQSDQTRINLTSFGVGTYYYLPPETFLGEDAEVSSKVDVWSVGVIFFELLYGRKPFGNGISQNKIYNQGIILKAVKVEFPQQTPSKHKVSEGAKKFIMDCLKYNQEERLSPLEAYQHQYFK